MRKALLFFLLIILQNPNHSLAEQDGVILLSQGIIPYHRASDGVKEKMPAFRIKEYILENETDQGQKLVKRLEEAPPRFIVAVGPEAASVLGEPDIHSTRVFTMILNPESLFQGSLPFPGVSMNYPISTVLYSIKKAFPGRENVGIFYSPESNASMIAEFEREAASVGLRIRPFPIASSSEIRSTLTSSSYDPAVILFIPDRVVIKEKLITYIIEECLFRKVPAVGFNTWFTNNGAAMALCLDYEELGWQTAELVLKLLANRNLQPWVESPRHLRIILNLKVIRKFGINVSEEIKAEADKIIE